MRQLYADNKEERKAYRREWRSKNKDKRNAWEARYRETHRALVRKTGREWWRKQANQAKLLILSLPCLECGLFHNEETRLRIIGRLLPCTALDIREAHPCLWPAGDAGRQKLNRDLRKVADHNGRDWIAKKQVSA